MPRLNNSLRADIRANALNGAYEKKRDKFEDGWLDLADAVYVEATKKSAKLLEQLPKGLLPTSKDIYPSFNGCRDLLTLKEEKIIPASLFHYSNTNGQRFVVSQKLTDRWQELRKVKEDLNEAYRILDRDVFTILNSVQTIKRLLEVWPEANDYIPSYVWENGALPTVQVESINTALKDAKKE